MPLTKTFFHRARHALGSLRRRLDGERHILTSTSQAWQDHEIPVPHSRDETPLKRCPARHGCANAEHLDYD